MFENFLVYQTFAHFFAYSAYLVVKEIITL